MIMLRFLSTALIAATMLATPAVARESHVTSWHRTEDANASTTPGAHGLWEGAVFRGNPFGAGFGDTPADGYGGYGNRASSLRGGFLGYGAATCRAIGAPTMGP